MGVVEFELNNQGASASRDDYVSEAGFAENKIGAAAWALNISKSVSSRNLAAIIYSTQRHIKYMESYCIDSR